jgi:glycosyltransferase involved in cell wall biosynthesis
MLSFVMTTRNEGVAFQNSLEALAQVMQKGDRVIAIDTGSSDDTPQRLAAFSEDVACDVICLESSSLHSGRALALGLEYAQTPYVMLLGALDRLHKERTERLRQALKEVSPDLALVDSGWWYADASYALPRVDVAQIATLPAHGPVSVLYRLCPEPRRLVLARDVWRPQRMALAGEDTVHALYERVIEQGDRCLFLQEQAVLHPYTTTDPVPLLEALSARLTALPLGAQEAGLRAGMIWADDSVARTAADQGTVLIEALEALSKCLPRRLHWVMQAHDGPAGIVMRARKSGGQQGALLCFVQMALASQQQHNRLLVAQLERLQKERHAALPLPPYLQALYDRARGL